jgi:hypothetical protein
MLSLQVTSFLLSFSFILSLFLANQKGFRRVASQTASLCREFSVNEHAINNNTSDTAISYKNCYLWMSFELLTKHHMSNFHLETLNKTRSLESEGSIQKNWMKNCCKLHSVSTDSSFPLILQKIKSDKWNVTDSWALHKREPTCCNPTGTQESLTSLMLYRPGQPFTECTEIVTSSAQLRLHQVLLCNHLAFTVLHTSGENVIVAQ